MGKKYEIFKDFSFVLLVWVVLHLSRFYTYLCTHTIAELFCISIAFTTFTIFWTAQKHVNTCFLLYYGIASLFIGILDFFHAISYMGLNIIEGSDAMQIWVGTRYFESLTLLISIVFKKKNVFINKYLIFSAYSIITALILASILLWKNFPVCFIQGVGPTLFNTISEYIICIILMISMFYLYKNKAIFKNNSENNIYNLIQVAFACKIISALIFTLQIELYGLLNMAGHYFMIISYYFIYKAVVVKAIREPYETIFLELKANEEKLIQQYEICQVKMNIDGLTDLYNHRYIYEQVESEIKRCDRFNSVFSIILFDIDRFKLVNDQHGHLIGDEILKEVAQIIKNNTGKTDVVGRYGGEEFLVVLPQTNLEAAFNIAEKIRLDIEQTKFTKDISITISGGLSQYNGDTANNMIAIADNNLYKAKNGGRNLNIM